MVKIDEFYQKLSNYFIMGRDLSYFYTDLERDHYFDSNGYFMENDDSIKYLSINGRNAKIGEMSYNFFTKNY